MSTVIICLILILIGIYSIKSYSKKLSHGCCGGESEPVKSIRPSDKNKKHYSYCKKVEINGMTCQNCKKRIENIFNQKENYYMDIHLNKNTGFLYTKELVSDTEIKNTIQSLGYQVIGIEEIAV